MNLKSIKKLLFLVLMTVIASVATPNLYGKTEVFATDSVPTTGEIPEPSGGSYMLHQSSAGVALGPHSRTGRLPTFGLMAIGTPFDGFGFDDNSTETGFLFIPPDPIGAAGTDRLIAVVNVMIEARTKAGGLLWRDSLKDFFTSLTPANFLFDPKVVYDHYENRFVVVALEKVDAGTNPNAGNKSRILLAVSKTASPATATTADWYYHAINSKESITQVVSPFNTFDHWADYPGFEVDEEAVYITASMFAHTGGATTYRVRLWILDKGVSGGFYGGSAAAVVKYDPYLLAGFSGYEVTTMPALVYGAGGIGPGIGTFLVGYGGYTSGGVGGSEYIFVIRVDDPLNAGAGITFTQGWCNIGDIEDVGGAFGWPALPDAPQSGTSELIEVNDRRALDAVWRNNRLWLTTTINPRSGTDAGETTAHWIRINTSTLTSLTLDDQGDIGGEDIATDTYTFFPSVAVNNAGNAKFGFSASAATIYAGAYVTGRQAGDTAGTVQATETVRAGAAYYVRTFDASPCSTPPARNRWGDYSGTALDPTDDNIFWVFNEYAASRGSATTGGCNGRPASEDGRWGTAWASCSFGTSSIIHVEPNGVCGGKAPCYSSVQDGIDAAATPATIKIAEANYDEDVVLDEAKELLLQGGWNAAFTTFLPSQSSINSLTIEDGSITPQNMILIPAGAVTSIIGSEEATRRDTAYDKYLRYEAEPGSIESVLLAYLESVIERGGFELDGRVPVMDMLEKDSARDLIIHFYTTILGREPEEWALEAWAEGYFNYAMSLGIDAKYVIWQMGRLFLISEEYWSGGKSEADFITDCYRAFLHRDPDETELQEWLSADPCGGEVIAWIALSHEFTKCMASFFTGNEGVASRNFITAIYIGLMDSVAMDENLTYWSESLEEATDKVEAARFLVDEIIRSGAFLENHPNGDEGICRVYCAFLGRLPTESEQEYWALEFEAGSQGSADVISQLVYSEEFILRLEEFLFGYGSVE